MKIVLPGDELQRTKVRKLKPIVSATSGRPDKALRRQYIEETLWALNELQPGSLRAYEKYLREISAAQTRKWRTGRGELKVQLPDQLFLTLRGVFEQFLPEQPMFGDIESDIFLLQEVVPTLVIDKFGS